MLNDDDIDVEFEKLRKERGIFPYVTVIDLKTGEISTCRREDAKRDIDFGSVIETVPADPDHAKIWLAKLHSDVMEQMRAKGAWQPSEYLGREMSDIDVFDDWSAWCGTNGFRSLPVEDVNVLVRYLIERHRDGVQESYVRRYATIVSRFHECTKHPVLDGGKLTRTSLSRKAEDAFSRALSFARNRLSAEERSIHLAGQAVAARALEMFPDGDIPRHSHEIAA